MKAFIGVLILMGIYRLPRLRRYWTTKHRYICPRISEIMSLTRFEQIYRFLHLCDSDKEVVAGQPGYDYLFKVRNLLDLLSPRFLYQYHTHEELSVDEAMIPFKGRLSIKQYMKISPPSGESKFLFSLIPEYCFPPNSCWKKFQFVKC